MLSRADGLHSPSSWKFLSLKIFFIFVNVLLRIHYLKMHSNDIGTLTSPDCILFKDVVLYNIDVYERIAPLNLRFGEMNN